MLSQKRAREIMLIALALAMGTYAHAAPSLDDIWARGLIRGGVKTDTPPFGSFDKDGRHVGFESDLARFFVRVLLNDDSRAQLVPVTTGTWFGELQAVRVDLLIATVTAIEVLLAMSAGHSCSARAHLSTFP